MKTLMITVTHNDPEYCLLLLNSIINSSEINKVIIRDNGSNQRNYEQLENGIKSLNNTRKLFEQKTGISNIEQFLELIKGENVGLSKAWNKAILNNQDYDYYVITSSDVILDKNTLSTLKETMIRHKPEDIVLNPVLYKITNSKKTEEILATGIKYSKKIKLRFSLAGALNLSKRKNNEKIKIDQEAKYNIEIRCSGTSFGCLFFSKNVLERIGLFNENFFLFNEDSDFFLRLRKENIPIYLATNTKVWHPDKSISNNDTSDFILYHRIKSEIIFYRMNKKYLESFYFTKYTVFLIMKLIQSLVNRRFKKIKTIKKAYIDGLKANISQIPHFN